MKTKRAPGRPRADAARDLRADLLQAARALLDEAGPDALSLREVARRAGCTHQAPYHYFEDRETLLAALVTDGFDELARRLRVANELAGTVSLRDLLTASGEAYVAFALAQPGVFRIMFRADMCDRQRFSALREAGGAAYAQLQRLNTLVLGTSATPASATVLWAHVHGLACLLLEGPLGPQLQTRRQQQAHLREVAQLFADRMLGPLGDSRAGASR